MTAALAVMAVGYEEDRLRFESDSEDRVEFSLGREFIRANGERSIWLFTVARWACIPYSIMGGLFCFLWARELWGSNGAALLSMTLWCFDPNVLAHGELVTTDCAAASIGLGATYFYWRWLKRPTWHRAALAGLLLGLAQLTKMSLLLLLGLWPVLWLIWVLYRRQHGMTELATHRSDSSISPSACANYRQFGTRLSNFNLRSQSAQLVFIFAMAVYVLNLGYGFDGSFIRLKKYTFVSHLMTGKKPGNRGNRFTAHILGELRVPVPEQYVLGLDRQRRDLEDFPHPSYLRGEWNRQSGWWYYYAYAMCVKTPHALQILLIVAFSIHLRTLWLPFGPLRHGNCEGPRHSSRGNLRLLSTLTVLAPAVCLFVIVSCHTQINDFRYVLPCFGFLFVLAGCCAASDCDTPPATTHGRRWCSLACVTAVSWLVMSSVSNHPHQLSYFNELAGGGKRGHRHLLGSSFDWGQDLLYLREWLQNYNGASPVFISFQPHFDPASLGLRFSPFEFDEKGMPVRGIYAIGGCSRHFPSTLMQGGRENAVPLSARAESSIFQAEEIIIGQTIFLYDFR